MRAGVAVAVAAAALAAGACGNKDKDQGKPKDAGAAVAAAPRPIPACERYAAALAASDDLVAQPEIHDLLRDEAALVRAANRAPTDAGRAELTLRCAAGLLDLDKIANDGYGGDAGAPIAGDIDAGVATTGSGPDCQAMLHGFDRLDACSDIPEQERATFRDRRSMMTGTWSNATDADAIEQAERRCRIATSGLQHALTQYGCP